MSSERNISFTAIRVKQPMGDLLICNIDARTMVDISYSDVRRMEERDVEKYLGVQRPLDQSRVKEIKSYLMSPDASFPTGVVLAVDQKCAEFDPNTNTLHLKDFLPDADQAGEHEPIPLGKVAKILDGQHRIAAFTIHEKNADKYLFDETLSEINFEFNAVIFVGLDIDEQANIFATVNLAQTKVNKSLVYDLEGLSKSRSPFKTCHKIAVTLDSVDPISPLYERIKRLGVKTKGREYSEPLTQAVFVEALMRLISPDPFSDRILYLKGKEPSKVEGNDLKKFPLRNMFIEKKDQEIALIIYNYFSCIKELWPKAWEEKDKIGNILPRSNAFRAFMRFLKLGYPELVSGNYGKVPSVDEFKTLFKNLAVSDEDFTSGHFKPGSGGESAFFKLLTGVHTIEDLKEAN